MSVKKPKKTINDVMSEKYANEIEKCGYIAKRIQSEKLRKSFKTNLIEYFLPVFIIGLRDRGGIKLVEDELDNIKDKKEEWDNLLEMWIGNWSSQTYKAVNDKLSKRNQ